MTRFKAFAKVEKAVVSVPCILNSHVDKAKRVPRLINNPPAQLNVHLAPFTSAVASLVKSVFNHSSSSLTRNILYASGCTPPVINSFMQQAWDFSLKILEDDVSFMDLSQSLTSLTEISHFINGRFDNPPSYLLQLLLSQIQLNIKTTEIQAFLGCHNASGVPTTTLSNSIVCIFARLIALANVFINSPLTERTYSDYLLVLAAKVIPSIRMAVAGDDGYLCICDDAYPYSYDSSEFLDRYSAGFAHMGLDVGRSKIRTFGPHNWRLSTFLAMRPYYTTGGYCLGPELARRLSTAFWRINSSVHPVSWLRGNAKANLISGHHVPLWREINQWILNNTKGPYYVTSVQDSSTEVDRYSIFYDWVPTGEYDPRALTEFLVDYGISSQDYDHFLSVLDQVTDPFVSLDLPMFDLVLACQ
jgi:hypothetical protein